jgi:hypothetical protein
MARSVGERGRTKEGVLMSNDHEKRDNENYAKNFTRVPNIVFESYEHLTHEEKFLYIKLKCAYWDARPRFASLRDISRLTGYAISALSRILPRLHKCGLIHAEIKQEFNPDGTKKGKPKYYITIPDIWEMNRKYFECSLQERFDPSNVLLENENVPLKNDNVLLENENVPPQERKCSSQERFVGDKASPQARSQLPKDILKDLSKDLSKEGSVADETEPQTLAPVVAPSPSSLSSLSSEETKASSKKKEKKTVEPKGPPVMPTADAPWPSRETAVQIVEAKKGRIYSATTRKQELEEAGKVLEMIVDNAPITREQFESAWDDLASSSWWEEHGKPCMIKYLRRDDTVVGIIKKLQSRQKRVVINSAQTGTRPSFLVSEERRQKNIEKLLAGSAAKAAKE